jgi:hypothetical protein
MGRLTMLVLCKFVYIINSMYKGTSWLQGFATILIMEELKHVWYS